MSVIHGEGGPPPQLEGSQHREEAARQQQELGKEWEDREEEGLRAERRPASLLRTECQLRQAIGALQIEDHKLARERSLIRQLETNLQHREEALRQQQAGAREGPEGGTSGGWELQGAFLGPYLRMDNRQP